MPLACAEQVSLQLKWKHQFQFAGFYMAKEKGFYAERGLDVDIVEANSNTAVDANVAKHLGVYGVSDTSVLLRREGGEKLKVLAAIFQHSPLVLMVLESSPYYSAADLKGAKLMLAPKHNTDITAALATAGLQSGDYIMLATRYDIHDLVNGNTDAFAAYSTDQPYQLDRLGVAYRIISPREQGIDFYGDLLITSEAETQSHPERVKAFTEASLLGWTYALEHMDEAIDVILAHYNSQHLSRQQLQFEAKATQGMIMGDVVQIGYMSPARWHHIAKVYASQHLFRDFTVLNDLIYKPKVSFWDAERDHIWQVLFFIGGLMALLVLAHIIHLRRVVALRADTLRQSEERFRAMFENKQCVELVVGADDGFILDTNHAAEQFYGYSKIQMLGKHISEVNVLSRAQLTEVIQQALIDGRFHHFFQHRLASGEIRDVEVYSGKISWGGQAALYWMIHDITARKQAEATVQKLSNAVTYMGEGMAILDVHGHVEYANPALTQITGFSPESIQGKRILDVFPQAFDAKMRQGLRAHMLAGKIWRHHVSDKQYNGDTFTGMLTVTAVCNSAGTFEYMVALLQNLTEFEALEHRFYQAQKMEAIGTLVGGIAHDFNNILAGIHGNLYLAKRHVDLPADIVQRLNTIETLSARGGDMIAQLLTFARKGNVTLAQLELTAFMQEALVLIRSTVPENIDMEYSISDQPITVLGDVTQIHQILMNLVSNARDALAEVEQPCLRIMLDVFEPDAVFLDTHTYAAPMTYAHMGVADNGSGIDAEHIQHLFEPFFTTKAQGLGTGLGLAMVFGATKAHGGFVEVESQTHVGTTFHVYIPLVVAVQKMAASPAAPALIQGRGETILLVDDEINIIEMGKEVLSNLGYHVLTAMNGEEAINIYQTHTHPIDVVIMDMVMPKMGGLAAAEAMRKSNPMVRVIYSTGYDKDGSLPEHAVVISKPYSIEKLSQIVRRTLDH